MKSGTYLIFEAKVGPTDPRKTVCIPWIGFDRIDYWTGYENKRQILHVKFKSLQHRLHTVQVIVNLLQNMY